MYCCLRVGKVGSELSPVKPDPGSRLSTLLEFRDPLNRDWAYLTAFFSAAGLGRGGPSFGAGAR